MMTFKLNISGQVLRCITKFQLITILIKKFLIKKNKRYMYKSLKKSRFLFWWLVPGILLTVRSDSLDEQQNGGMTVRLYLIIIY